MAVILLCDIILEIIMATSFLSFYKYVQCKTKTWGVARATIIEETTWLDFMRYDNFDIHIVWYGTFQFKQSMSETLPEQGMDSSFPQGHV